MFEDPKELKEASKIRIETLFLNAFASIADPFPLILFQCINKTSRINIGLVIISARN